MTDKINDGGPAYPCDTRDYLGADDVGEMLPGMSLRDWFAGQAVKGAMAAWFSCTESQRKAMSGCVDVGLIFQRDFPKFVARLTDCVADVMLKERARD